MTEDSPFRAQDPAPPATPAALAEAMTADCGGGDGLKLFLQEDLELRLTHSQTGPRDLDFQEAAKRVAAWRPLPWAQRWRGRPWLWIFLGLAALILGGMQQWSKQPGPDSSGRTAFTYSNSANDPSEKIRKEITLPDDQVPARSTPEQAAAAKDPAAYMAAILSLVYPPPKEIHKVAGGGTVAINSPSLPLPADYEQTWQRLDPDNAQWLLLELQMLNESLLHQKQDPLKESEAAAKALELFERAARLPRCDQYWQERRKFKLAAYRAPRCWSEAEFLNRETMPTIKVSGDWMFERGLEEFDKQGNQDALQRVSQAHAAVEAALWHDLASRCPEMHAFELPLNFTIPSFPPEGTSALHDEVRKAMGSVAGSASRIMGNMTRPVVWDQDFPIGTQEPRLFQRPKGVRLLDLSEMCWHAEMALLALAAAAWVGLCLVTLRQAPWARGAAWRAAGCLQPLALPSRADAAALGLWGVALPALWVAGWLCFSTGPLLHEFRWVLAGYAGVLGAVALTVAMQGRLARRLRVAGFASGRGSLILSRLVLVLTAAALPLLLAVLDADPQRQLPLEPRPGLSATGALACAGLLWLVLAGFTGIFSRERAVRQILLARRLIAPLGCITILIVLCATALNFQERAFARQAVEEMTRPVPSLAAKAAAEQMWKDWRE